ncbi:hypothetical protein [Nocardioides terrisoli]|nr:hypothetical protein [Nocardioides marmorisolisilvae]
MKIAIAAAVGAVIAVAGAVGGVAAYQGSPHGVSQTSLYTYADN